MAPHCDPYVVLWASVYRLRIIADGHRIGCKVGLCFVHE